MLLGDLSPQRPGQTTHHFFSVFVLLCVCLVHWPYTIYFILLWLKVPLNTNEPTNQPLVAGAGMAAVSMLLFNSK